MTNDTTQVKLLCQQRDSLDYTTYVFEIIDSNEIQRLGYRYIMCTRWPNWDHRELLNGEEGYLNYSIIIAGQDAWFNGEGYTPYKTSVYQFNKFIAKQPEQNKHSFKL